MNPEQQIPLRPRRTLNMPFYQIVALPIAVAASLACLGCGGADWQAETYPAHGQITINGKPPSGAVVELHSTGQQPDVRNSRPWGIVQEDGTYALSTYQRYDGAPPGEYAITVRWPPDVSQPSLADRLSHTYANPDRSQWEVQISERDNDLPPIEITGARVLSAAHARAPKQAPPGPAMGN